MFLKYKIMITIFIILTLIMIFRIIQVYKNPNIIDRMTNPFKETVLDRLFAYTGLAWIILLLVIIIYYLP